ncbi:hypothetical protein INT45_014153 [Circinella minor]|uniref:Uncharacterized protein n=1 Tax=Circinella minor TaxID=1195481 RepID=A0A8H7RKE1_9FUNG|nr:hypothetical protein INT45_014153 [Circinella minor]
MPTIGERNAARAQRNMDRNAVIQQDNRRNTALQIEDRIRELETRNTVLESRVEAMGNVIARQALAQQQEVQLQLAVSQNPDTVMMDGTVHDNRIQSSDNVSGAIRNHNTALASEGFRWNETYRSVYNRATKASILAYIEGFRQHAIQEKRKTSNQRNTCRHAKRDRRLKAFHLHQARIQECYPGAEALLQVRYMSEEETDDKYEGEVGKHVVVWQPQWRNEKANEFLWHLDQLAPPSDATRLVKRFGGVRVAVLSGEEEEKLGGWIAV